MERLFGSIPEILKGLGIDGGASEAVAFAAWRQCAGELIGERTEPLEFFENRLIVAVPDQTWRAHLEDLAGQLVGRLNTVLGQGSVKFIEFRNDPAQFPDRKVSDDARVVDANDLPESVVQAADNIADEHLRESFLNAAAVYLSKE